MHRYAADDGWHESRIASANAALSHRVFDPRPNRRRPSRPAHLASFPVVELRFDELAVGDYVVDNRVVFERKTTEDFARSIIDTRLFRQASMLARSSYRSAVIIEGDFETSRSGVSREAMQGALISLALVFDIPVLRSTCSEETVRLLLHAAKQLADLNHQNRPWHAPCQI